MSWQSTWTVNSSNIASVVIFGDRYSSDMSSFHLVSVLSLCKMSTRGSKRSILVAVEEEEELYDTKESGAPNLAATVYL